MYLVCCPNPQIKELVKALAEINIISLPIYLMDFEPNINALNWLEENINNYKYIMLNSPTVIDFSVKAIIKATCPTFLTVGKSSADQLKELTKQEVFYPKHSVGELALFNEIMQNLDLLNNEILIVKGNLGNDTVRLELEQRDSKWKVLEIYKRIQIKQLPGHLKKTLNSGRWQGIIVTSSLLVDWLFAHAAVDGCVELLKASTFIVIHKRIAENLMKLGASRVLITQDTSRKSIIELIRNLHD